MNKFLDKGEPLWNHPELDRDLIADLQLLTCKPVIYLFNVDEAHMNDEARREALNKIVAPARAVFVCAKLESELKDLDGPDAAELLASYGQKESGLVQLVRAAYDVLACRVS